MIVRHHSVAVLALALGLGAWACSGRDDRQASPTGPSVTAGSGGVAATGLDGPSPLTLPSPTPTASPSPSPAPSPLPGAPSGSPALDTVAACPFGKGSINASCDRNNPEYLADVEFAIDQVIDQKPALFDKSRVIGTRDYYILDVGGFYQAVMDVLLDMGYCAQYKYDALDLKKSADHSETYDLVLSNGHIRRGQGSYRSSCTPANFPLDASDVIDSIRVAFFGMTCPDDVVTPRNGEGLLPIGCEGYVTATPKKADGSDVEPDVHGPDIEWYLEQDDDFVREEDFPGVTFNKTLTGQHPGHFSLCAVVKGFEGCLHGEVPAPEGE